jgi:hypothetical protein
MAWTAVRSGHGAGEPLGAVGRPRKPLAPCAWSLLRVRFPRACFSFLFFFSLSSTDPVRERDRVGTGTAFTRQLMRVRGRHAPPHASPRPRACCFDLLSTAAGAVLSTNGHTRHAGALPDLFPEDSPSDETHGRTHARGQLGCFRTFPPCSLLGLEQQLVTPVGLLFFHRAHGRWSRQGITTLITGSTAVKERSLVVKAGQTREGTGPFGWFLAGNAGWLRAMRTGRAGERRESQSAPHPGTVPGMVHVTKGGAPMDGVLAPPVFCSVFILFYHLAPPPRRWRRLGLAGCLASFALDDEGTKGRGRRIYAHPPTGLPGKTSGRVRTRRSTPWIRRARVVFWLPLRTPD